MEIRNTFPVIRWVHWGGVQNKDIGAAQQTLLTGLRLRLRRRLYVRLHEKIHNDDF